MELDSGTNFTNTETFKHDSIEPINSDTIHKICSGQVVLSLAIAVKELVENAIDASATNIEVRLKEFGSELLEVSDNGTGVRKENFQTLTLKHFTSKLREFTDLESVATLGFRGEALSSLCALSELTVVTRHASADHGTKLRYDINGKIIEETPAARNPGTTVSLANLFISLPVRRKEFVKNLKREYSKMCQLLYAYCLVSKGIKFTCTNLANGSRNVVISTEGSNSIRDNIISVFGAKQMPSLIQVELAEPNNEILEEYKVKLTPGEPLLFSFDCFISSASHGSGRSTNDRQFFYINSRPCEPHKIMKLVNSIYKQFNSGQYPFVYLNVNIERSLVDVNVTPDKRQVFVDNEKLLLAILKSSLLEAFKNCPSTYTVQNVEVNRIMSELKGVKRGLNGSISDLFQKRCKSDTSITKKETSRLLRQASLIETGNVNITKTTGNNAGTPKKSLEEEVPHVDKPKESQVHSEEVVSLLGDFELVQSQADTSLDKLLLLADKLQDSTHEVDAPKQHVVEAAKVSPGTIPKTKPVIEGNSLTRKNITILSSMKYVKEALAATCKPNAKRYDEITVNFHSQITPASNKSAENELQKQITKDKFKKMSVIGQFNLGFIIAQLEDDLFIIDQHASDEKYNFEQLQLNTALESQVLVNPKSLELTAANEDLLIENVEVFEKNGFGFSIDCNAPATKKVSLTSIPMSRNYIFGKNDIEEMLFMLQEGINPAICRPSRVQLMFATRACRKSVMVGCPLNKSDMRRLVDHMGEIDQPWNCPHGRPTMRHLINLKLLENK